jgi:Helix-turn-helix domain
VNPLTMDVPPALVEEIAQRAAEIVADRQGAGSADGWLRGAERIAGYLDCSTSRVYSLVSSRRIPVRHDGAAVVARRSELDAWIEKGGARCP